MAAGSLTVAAVARAAPRTPVSVVPASLCRVHALPGDSVDQPNTPPTTYQLPSGVDAQRGDAAFETPDAPRGQDVIVGPSGYECVTDLGADVDVSSVLTAPGASAPSFEDVYGRDEAYASIRLECGWFPDLRARAAAAHEAQDCNSSPPGEQVDVLPEVAIGQQAAVITVPAGVKDTNFAASPAPEGGTTAAVVLPVFYGFDSTGQLPAYWATWADCQLTTATAASCIASLEAYAGSVIDQRISQAAAGAVAAERTLRAAVLSKIAALAKATEPNEEVECDEQASTDVDLETTHEADPEPDSGIDVKGLTEQLPNGLQAAVHVDFTPGKATVCDHGLAVSVNTPFPLGGLFLHAAAAGATAATDEILRYHLETAAWDPDRLTPPGAELKTKFDPASFHASVVPSLNITISPSANKAPDVGVTILSATVDSLRQSFQLVSEKGAGLEVALGPELELRVSIDREKLEGDTATAEEENPEASEAEIAAEESEQIALDAVESIDETLADSYGVIVDSGAVRAELREVADVVSDAVLRDPELVPDATGRTPYEEELDRVDPAADPVLAEETAAEAADLTAEEGLSGAAPATVEAGGELLGTLGWEDALWLLLA